MDRTETLLPAAVSAAPTYPSSPGWKGKFIAAARFLRNFLLYSRTAYSRKCLEYDMQSQHAAGLQRENAELKEWIKRADAMLAAKIGHSQHLTAIIGGEWGAHFFVSTFASTEVIVAINDLASSYATIRIYASARGKKPLATATLRTTNKFFKLNLLSLTADVGEAVLERALIVSAMSYAAHHGAEGICGVVLGSMIDIGKIQPVFESMGFTTEADHRTLKFEKRIVPATQEKVLPLAFAHEESVHED